MCAERILRMSALALALAFVLRSSQASAEPTPKRAVPSYDGRAPQTSASDIALWVPRILFSPLYFVSEFVLRRPLGALITWAERAGAPKFLYDLFTFGPSNGAGVLPIAYLHFGFNPSVGLMFYWNDAGVKGHDLSFSASTWGLDWLAGIFTQRVRLNESTSLRYEFSAIRRPDLRFHGVGPTSLDRDLRRFGQDALHSHLTFETRPIPGRAGRLETFLGQRRVSLYEGRYQRDAGLFASARAAQEPLPDGFSTGFSTVDAGGKLSFDSRPVEGGSALSGARVETEFAHSSDLLRSPGSSWVTYGGGVGGFVALTERGRVLGLSVHTRFVDPIGTAPVPVVEYVDPGGDGPLRGFLMGRLRGRSYAVANLRYHWPVWVNLDGTMEFAMGNVFDERLRGFQLDQLRYSAAIGIETSKRADNAFQILLGVGSETFQQGGGIDSVRFVIGTHRGL
jgi:hypothetical protein